MKIISQARRSNGALSVGRYMRPYQRAEAASRAHQAIALGNYTLAAARRIRDAISQVLIAA